MCLNFSYITRGEENHKFFEYYKIGKKKEIIVF